MPADTPTPDAPDQNQDSKAVSREDTPQTEVSTHETDGARIAEAGHGYVGRQMDDDLKSSPRVKGTGEADEAGNATDATTDPADGDDE